MEFGNKMQGFNYIILFKTITNEVNVSSQLNVGMSRSMLILSANFLNIDDQNRNLIYQNISLTLHSISYYWSIFGKNIACFVDWFIYRCIINHHECSHFQISLFMQLRVTIINFCSMFEAVFFSVPMEVSYQLEFDLYIT